MIRIRLEFFPYTSLVAEESLYKIQESLSNFVSLRMTLWECDLNKMTGCDFLYSTNE